MIFKILIVISEILLIGNDKVDELRLFVFNVYKNKFVVLCNNIE